MSAGPVRDEDAFDVARAAAWLRSNAPQQYAAWLGSVEVPEVRQFDGGASNLTYLLRYPAGDLVLRRPPSGTKARGAHDVVREHDIQAALAPVFPAVVPMVGACADDAVIGSPFYVMEALSGPILRRDIPPDWGWGPDQVRQLCLNAVDLLVSLHGVPVGSAGLDHLGRGPGYVGRQVAGWSERYRRARTDDVLPLEDVMGWLEREQPADVAECLIHNDFRFDNLVLAADGHTDIAAVLDWEMATVGDPLMDLGGALAYWVQADDDAEMLALRRQPTHTPGMLSRAEVVSRYAEATGRSVGADQWRFYEIFGLFRLAVIGQQIYFRFARGETHNPAYAGFADLVRYLGDRCRFLVAAA